MPDRVQLSRAKGWRMPPNTVSVARPTACGNPFVIGGEIANGPYAGVVVRSAEHAVTLFHEFLLQARRDLLPNEPMARVVAKLGALRGKNLACWCPPGQPCHADVLLDFANRPDVLDGA